MYLLEFFWKKLMNDPVHKNERCSEQSNKQSDMFLKADCTVF